MNPNPFSRIFGGWRTAILLAAMGLAGFFVISVRAQTDNFDDGNDVGWTRYKPLDDALGGTFSTFQLANGRYRLTGTAPPVAVAGPARTASVRNDRSYQQFCQSVDVVNWNDSLTQSIGLLARLSNIGLGQTNGYAFTYQTDDHDLQITRITGELNPASSTNPKVTLVVGKSYRFVFIGDGPNLAGRVYELPNLTTPMQTVSWTDDAYAEGVCGIFIFDPSSAGNQGCDATFDNYAASDFTPPPLSISLAGTDTYKITWPALVCFTLESSLDLSLGGWSPESTNIDFDPVLNQFVHQDDIITAQKFYRLVYGP